MEAARQLKANLKFKDQPCRSCDKPFAVGDDLSVCTECESAHHTACWDTAGGCAGPGCANAPLKKLDPPKPQAREHKQCPSCFQRIELAAPFCSYCGAPADGQYRGPQISAPGAVASMVFGIIAIPLSFLCGIGLIFGIIAIVKSREASRCIQLDPQYGGQGFAVAGLVLGIIGTVLGGFGVLGFFLGMAGGGGGY